MAQTDAFVSCSLCGAIFTGEVLPDHACFTTSALSSVRTTPLYHPPTMELRDFLAASALTGVLARNYLPGTTAEKCYEIADAMIKARQHWTDEA